MSDADRIGRYRLWEEVGRGATTLVRRATAPGVPPVAAKLLRPDLAAGPEARDLLTRIGGTLHHLPHPGIVRMHDLVADAGRVALIVDFVDGPSLRAYLAGEGGRLPLEDAAVVAAQVADVLAAVHARGLMHLDLKPENVLLVGGAYPLRAKVADFGMAALPGSAENPGYAAPELTAGGPPTAAADVYALGVMLAEMTTGTLPAPGRSGLELVPHPIRDLVRDCLATHPWERPAAVDVAARIRAAVVVAGMPPPPGEPPVEAPAERVGLRRPVLVAAAAGVLFLGMIIGLSIRAGDNPTPSPEAATGFGSRPRDEPTVERQSLANAAPGRATFAARLANGRGTLSLAVRDGRAVAYLCDGDQVEAWLKGTAQGDRVSLTGSDGAALSGTIAGDRVTGRVTLHQQPNDFSLPRVTAPSGLYRAAARLRNAEIKGGWIVLPDGSQVGVLTTDGVPGPAPRLDTAARSAAVEAGAVAAVPVDVATGTGF